MTEEVEVTAEIPSGWRVDRIGLPYIGDKIMLPDGTISTVMSSGEAYNVCVILKENPVLYVDIANTKGVVFTIKGKACKFVTIDTSTTRVFCPETYSLESIVPNTVVEVLPNSKLGFINA